MDRQLDRETKVLKCDPQGYECTQKKEYKAYEMCLLLQYHRMKLEQKIKVSYFMSYELN
jgi:hypothetical protein